MAGNFWNIWGGKGSGGGINRSSGGSSNPTRNLNNITFPTDFERAKSDLKTIADALRMAEQAIYPMRSELQKVYEKALLNGHVASCVERRKELTLLREFEIQNANGEKDKHWTGYFQREWFQQRVLSHTLDAVFHGFSLISIGAIKDNIPDQIVPVKRTFVSPDRLIVSTLENGPSGYSFVEGPQKNWHLWVPTIQSNGFNNCGYGLLLVTSLIETLVRNNIQYNTDFIELFAQPLRVLKTNDTEGEEYEEKKRMLEDMGHNAAMIISLSDELEMLNDGSRGQGYKAYTDFDHRGKADISKYIGGHADFIDSTPRPMDSQARGGGDITDDASGNTQVQRASAAKRKLDGRFVTSIVNERLIPQLREIGVPIPEGMQIKFLNDSEERAIASQEAEKNQKFATLGLTLAQAGYRIKQGELEERLGMGLEQIQVSPDNNVVIDEKEQAKGKDPLKDESKRRTNKPKFTKKQ